MNDCFYIFKNIASNQPKLNRLNIRIFKLSKNLPSFKFHEVEGPYNSIRSLKRNSQIFQQLKKLGSKDVERSLKDCNISTLKDWIRIPKGQSYSMEFISAFEHTLRGHVKNKNVFGVHFYDPEKLRIIEIIRENKLSGIIEAKIEVYSKPKNIWVQKKRTTTIFPLTWDIEKLFHECDFAVTNKVKCSDKAHAYHSTTMSGIKVEIIMTENKINSIYPLID
jgi:hypothetical protein